MGNVATLVEQAQKLDENERVELLGTLLQGEGILGLAGILSSLETKFGVKAAAAPGPVDGGAKKTDAPAAPTIFDVVLKSAGAKKIDVIKVVRAETGIGLKEAKDLCDKGNEAVKKGLPKDEADKLAKLLKDAGAEVELKPA
jgi:large subunit ribosomal protein L7/L12